MPISNLTLEPWKIPSASEISQRLEQTQAQALANRDAAYQFRQKKTINDLMSKHTGAGGRIDWGRLMLDPEVVANGLGRDLQALMMGNKQAMAATGTDVAAQSEAMRAMGVDPNKMLREQELPESRTVYPGESSGSGFDAKTVQSVSSFLNGGRPSSIGSGVRSSVGPRGASAPMGDTDPNTVRVPGGVGGVDGAAAGMEPPHQEYGKNPPAEDWITDLQRSYDPARAMGGGVTEGAASAGGAGGAGGPPSVESETARKTWAEELVRSGMLREVDRDNPEAFQAALGNYWDKQVEALGPAPTMAMFLRGVKPGDPSSIMAARADFLKASQEYQKAQQGLAAKFFQGGSETFDKQRTQDLAFQGNERAGIQQEKELSQVSHPSISGYLPNTEEKRNLTDSSGAIRSMVELMKNPPDPNSSSWLPFKMILGKDLVKAYNLPVGEGLLHEVSGMIQNGASAAEAANTLQERGILPAISGQVARLLGQAAGVNDIGGAIFLTEAASKYARGKWGAYGKGSDFDTYFPEYKAGGSQQQGPATAPSAPAAGPRVGERKTKGGVVAEWNGKTWVRVQ